MDGSPVGLRGFVGVPALFDGGSSFHHCVMQVPGEGLRGPAAVVKTIFDSSVEFRDLVMRFVEARFVQSTHVTCSTGWSSGWARWLLSYRVIDAAFAQVTAGGAEG